jgi:hypothetical protein
MNLDSLYDNLNTDLPQEPGDRVDGSSELDSRLTLHSSNDVNHKVAVGTAPQYQVQLGSPSMVEDPRN